MAAAAGTMLVVSGPSGSGKSTLCRRLLADPRVEFSVSVTTRTPRAGEVDGRDYHFVDKARFKRHIEQGDFIEWAEVHGNLYGTPRGPMERALADQLAEARRREEVVLAAVDLARPRRAGRGRDGEAHARVLQEELAERRLAAARRPGDHDHLPPAYRCGAARALGGRNHGAREGSKPPFATGSRRVSREAEP